MSLIHSRLKTFFHDDSASSTVEFVLWVPLLITWLLCIVVFFDAFKARSALISANATLADIVSRNSDITEDYMDLLQVMQSALLPKTNGGGIRITTILYVIDPDIPGDPGTHSVIWSAVTGTMSTELEDEDIPLASLPDMYTSEMVVLIESTVPYQPITRLAGISLTQLRSSVVISPRYESRLVWIDD